MAECNQKSIHFCRAEDAHIPNSCKCTYGPDIEYDHGILNADPRCIKLRRKEMLASFDRSKRAMRQLPQWQRMDKKKTSYDDLHTACWHLNDKQIAEVAKYVKETYPTKTED